MAIPWLFMLKSVPWSDVISNAPKVADGAKKLWSTVAKKPSQQPESPVVQPATHASSEVQAVAQLDARLSSLEATVSELNSQMVASLEIVKALAEQNSQLVERIEANRVRTVWLALVAAAAAVALAIGLVVVMQGRT